MNFVIIDLEWNGTYVKKVHGFFNEIIEIGAVKLGDNLQEIDRFQAIIRPAVSKKLTNLVTNLTNITDDELEDGGTFTGAMAKFRRWLGKEKTVILTWSTTDLLVFLENYRYFLKTDSIPFMTAYVDLQAYYQKRMQLPTATQVGLAKAGEALQIDEQDIAHHRALDDSVLSGQVLQKIYDKKSFDQAVLPANASFYDRITFKVSYVTDVTDPLVKRDYLRFYCEQCGGKLQFKGKWRPHNRSLCCNGVCTVCGKKYTARVQIKKKYDAVDVKRKLIEKAEPDPEKEQQKEEEATV